MLNTSDELEPIVSGLRNSLFSIKDKVIGIFKIKDSVDLVVCDNGESVDCINISCFGAIQHTYALPKRFGEYFCFPGNKNMNEMLDNPIEWEMFMREISRT